MADESNRFTPTAERYKFRIETTHAHSACGFMCAVPLGHAAEKEYVPKLTGDVEKFTERRNLCDYFRGEALSD